MSLQRQCGSARCTSAAARAGFPATLLKYWLNFFFFFSETWVKKWCWKYFEIMYCLFWVNFILKCILQLSKAGFLFVRSTLHVQYVVFYSGTCEVECRTWGSSVSGEVTQIPEPELWAEIRSLGVESRNSTTDPSGNLWEFMRLQNIFSVAKTFMFSWQNFVLLIACWTGNSLIFLALTGSDFNIKIPMYLHQKKI